MATQTFSKLQARINQVKGEILAHAVQVEILAIGCEMKKQPRNQGDNITYRRFTPFGAGTGVNTQNRPAVIAAEHIVQEGVTPATDTISAVNVNTVQQQYACIYAYTNKTADLYEDDIPQEMRIQTGERMGFVREMIRFGVIKAGTNVLYSGGTSRATVDEAITLKSLRRMARVLKLNHAKKKRRMLSPSGDYDTSAIEAAYIVFVSTDAEPDIRDLPGFTVVAKYGTHHSVISAEEIGSCEEFRFLTSPELTAYTDSGVVTADAPGLVAESSNVDVYPFMVMGENACFDVALQGLDSYNFVHLPHNKPDKSDILGQRGYVGASFWSAVVLVNAGWMGVIEAGVTTQT